jgi:hypothetical protein
MDFIIQGTPVRYRVCRVTWHEKNLEIGRDRMHLISHFTPFISGMMTSVINRCILPAFAFAISSAPTAVSAVKTRQ